MPDGSVRINIAPGCSLLAEMTYAFAVKVENPLDPQPPRSVTIAIEYEGCSQCFETCGCNKTAAPPISLSAFPMEGSALGSGGVVGLDPIFLGENNSIPSQLNTISIIVRSNAALLPGSSITIMGITSTGFTSDMDILVRTPAGTPHELIRDSIGSFKFDAEALNASLEIELSN
eukprot:1258100-Rhodomonas_salina.1